MRSGTKGGRRRRRCRIGTIHHNRRHHRTPFHGHLATLPQGYLMTTKMMVVVRRGERGRRHRHHYLPR